jgi:hypothetical protein
VAPKLKLQRIVYIVSALALVLAAAIFWPDVGRPPIAAADNTVTVDLVEQGNSAGITFEPANISFDPPQCDAGFSPTQVCTDMLTIENAGIPFTYTIAAWVDTNTDDTDPPGPGGDDLVACFNLHLTTILTDGQPVGDLSSQGPFGPFTLGEDAITVWRLDASVDDIDACQGVQGTVMVFVNAEGIASPATDTPTPAPTNTPPPEAAEATPVPTATLVATTTATPVATTATPDETPTPDGTEAPARSTVPAAAGGTAAPTSTATPEATVTSTPSPTSTAVSTPTFTPTPTPTPPPTTGTQPPGNLEERPEIVSEVLDLRSISTDPVVVGSNLLLASIVLLLILLDATIFNEVIEENSALIYRSMGRIASPFLGLWALAGSWLSSLTRLFGAGGLSDRYANTARWLGVLFLSGLIYSLLEPGLGLNGRSIVLFSAIVVSLAATTLVYDGGKVLVAERGLGLDMAVRFFPIAILIACASVAISRVTDIHPGVIYGFVGATRLLPSVTASRREHGLIILFPMLALIATSLICWVLLTVVRPLSEDGSAVAVVIEGIAAAIFISGLQGAFFNLTPLQFVDGQKIWLWSRLVWFAVALPVVFLLFHVILNNSGEFDTALRTTSIQALLAACVGLWLATAALWLYFRLRQASAEDADLLP